MIGRVSELIPSLLSLHGCGITSFVSCNKICSCYLFIPSA